jgi:hypothetical protein
VKGAPRQKIDGASLVDSMNLIGHSFSGSESLGLLITIPVHGQPFSFLSRLQLQRLAHLLAVASSHPFQL